MYWLIKNSWIFSLECSFPSFWVLYCYHYFLFYFFYRLLQENHSHLNILLRFVWFYVSAAVAFFFFPVLYWCSLRSNHLLSYLVLFLNIDFCTIFFRTWTLLEMGWWISPNRLRMPDSLEFTQLLLSTDFRMSQYQSTCFKNGTNANLANCGFI